MSRRHSLPSQSPSPVIADPGTESRPASCSLSVGVPVGCPCLFLSNTGRIHPSLMTLLLSSFRLETGYYCACHMSNHIRRRSLAGTGNAVLFTPFPRINGNAFAPVGAWYVSHTSPGSGLAFRSYVRHDQLHTQSETKIRQYHQPKGPCHQVQRISQGLFMDRIAPKVPLLVGEDKLRP